MHQQHHLRLGIMYLCLRRIFKQIVLLVMLLFSFFLRKTLEKRTAPTIKLELINISHELTNTC